LDSLGELGIGGVVPIGLELELDVLPEPDIPLPDAPVPEVDVSAPGAGVGVGAVVEGAGAAGAEGAGGGTTTFSSFLLQAVKPIARAAAMRSERFMIFPLIERQRFCMKKNERPHTPAFLTTYSIVIRILAAPWPLVRYRYHYSWFYSRLRGCAPVQASSVRGAVPISRYPVQYHS
jgi:hypothetical protein